MRKIQQILTYKDINLISIQNIYQTKNYIYIKNEMFLTSMIKTSIDNQSKLVLNENLFFFVLLNFTISQTCGSLETSAASYFFKQYQIVFFKFYLRYKWPSFDLRRMGHLHNEMNFFKKYALELNNHTFLALFWSLTA